MIWFIQPHCDRSPNPSECRHLLVEQCTTQLNWVHDRHCQLTWLNSLQHLSLSLDSSESSLTATLDFHYREGCCRHFVDLAPQDLSLTPRFAFFGHLLLPKEWLDGARLSSGRFDCCGWMLGRFYFQCFCLPCQLTFTSHGPARVM